MIGMVLMLGFVAAGNPGSSSAAAAPDRAARVHHAATQSANRLIGMGVRDPKGRNLGHIANLIIDLDSGKVRYAILSFGGFLGLGNRLFAYPLHAFHLGGDDHLELGVAAATLRRAPGFDANRWPDWNGSYYGSVDQFFGSEGGTPYGRRLRRATDLIGQPVDDLDGKDIGRVTDLRIAFAQGKVDDALIEIDRIPALSDRLVAVSLSRLRPQAGSGRLVLQATRDQLRRLPLARNVGAAGRA